MELENLKENVVEEENDDTYREQRRGKKVIKQGKNKEKIRYNDHYTVESQANE